MAIFDDIELEWKGVTYKIRGDDQVMSALAAVEDHVTLSELFRGQEKGAIPMAKLSRAYGALLRRAGAGVDDAEVYNGMWEGGADTIKIQEAISSMLALMIPPGAAEAQEEEGDGEGNE